MPRIIRCQGIIFQNDQVVLLKHYNPVTDKFYWWFPGGGQNDAETPEQAAVREVYEETNLIVRSERLLHEMPDPERKFMYQTYLSFLCTPIGGELAVGHESSYMGKQILHDVKWFPLWDENQWLPVFADPNTHIYKMLKLTQNALVENKLDCP
jgi:8-oxo-dGTP pyrophosphatase MutT (NUDIX family)